MLHEIPITIGTVPPTTVYSTNWGPVSTPFSAFSSTLTSGSIVNPADISLEPITAQPGTLPTARKLPHCKEFSSLRKLRDRSSSIKKDFMSSLFIRVKLIGYKGECYQWNWVSSCTFISSNIGDNKLCKFQGGSWPPPPPLDPRMNLIHCWLIWCLDDLKRKRTVPIIIFFLLLIFSSPFIPRKPEVFWLDCDWEKRRTKEEETIPANIHIL